MSSLQALNLSTRETEEMGDGSHCDCGSILQPGGEFLGSLLLNPSKKGSSRAEAWYLRVQICVWLTFVPTQGRQGLRLRSFLHALSCPRCRGSPYPLDTGSHEIRLRRARVLTLRKATISGVERSSPLSALLLIDIAALVHSVPRAWAETVLG